MRPSAAPVTTLRTAGQRGVVALLAAVAASLVVLGAASPAAAHNALRSSDPADGATAATAPEQVTLVFDQEVIELGTEVVVTAADGTDVADGPAQVAGTSVVQPLAETRPAGEYRVVWRVTSADGHPISGELTFTATGAVGETEQAATDEPTATATDEPTATTPATATVTAAATTAPDPGSADGGTSAGLPVWLWVLCGAVALGAVVAAVVAARRRTAPGDDARTTSRDDG